MRLVEAYRSDISGLSTKEAKPLRALWHKTAKRYLNRLGFTSDPPPDFLPNDEGITTIPLDMYGIPCFLKRSRSELEELYRATKPRRV